MKTNQQNQNPNQKSNPNQKESAMKNLTIMVALMAATLSSTAMAQAPAATCEANPAFAETLKALKDPANKACNDKPSVKAALVGLGCAETQAEKISQDVCPTVAASDQVASAPAVVAPAVTTPVAVNPKQILKICRSSGSIDVLNRLLKRLDEARGITEGNLGIISDLDPMTETETEKNILGNLGGGFKKILRAIDKWKAEERNASAQDLLDYSDCLKQLGVTNANQANIDEARRQLEGALAEQRALSSAAPDAILAANAKVKEKEALLTAAVLDSAQPMDCHGKDAETKAQLEAILSTLSPAEAAPAKKKLAEIAASDPCQIVMTKVMAAAQVLPDKVYNRLILRQLFPEPAQGDKVAALVPDDASGTSFHVGSADAPDGLKVKADGLIANGTGTNVVANLSFIGAYFNAGGPGTVKGNALNGLKVSMGWEFLFGGSGFITPFLLGGFGYVTGESSERRWDNPADKRFVGILGAGVKGGFAAGIFKPYLVAEGYGLPGWGFSGGVGTSIKMNSSGSVAFDASLRYTHIPDTGVASGLKNLSDPGNVGISGLGVTAGVNF